MMLPKPSDAIHKVWLYRILSGIADDLFLVENLRFKGGTCAAMQGILERFSVDLDFDLLDSQKQQEVRARFEKMFGKLGLEIKEKSQHVPQYFLKYPGSGQGRNTVRLDVTFPPPVSNEYEPVRFVEIDRILYCQTIPTMFANKLVTIMDRYQKHNSLAGRDLYDVHTFFLKGYRYKNAIIEERTGLGVEEFFMILKKFVEEHFTQTVIDQDLNVLMPPGQFRRLRKVLKQEVLMFLKSM